MQRLQDPVLSTEVSPALPLPLPLALQQQQQRQHWFLFCVVRGWSQQPQRVRPLPPLRPKQPWLYLRTVVCGWPQQPQ